MAKEKAGGLSMAAKYWKWRVTGYGSMKLRENNESNENVNNRKPWKKYENIINNESVC